MRGFDVDEEHLALDLIDEVGPGGVFIDQPHTAQHFRKELWMPSVLDREYWSAWESAGRSTTAQRTRERMLELLGSYQQRPMDERASRDMQKVVEAAQRSLGT